MECGLKILLKKENRCAVMQLTGDVKKNHITLSRGKINNMALKLIKFCCMSQLTCRVCP